MLEPAEVMDTELLKAPHFAAYVQVYLSGAFLAHSVPVEVVYLARTYKFRVADDLVDELKSLSLQNTEETVFYVEPNCVMSFTNSSAASDEALPISVPFQEIGGCEDAKQIFERFFFEPLKR